MPAKGYFVFFRAGINEVEINQPNAQRAYLPKAAAGIINFSYGATSILGAVLYDASGNPVDLVRFGGTPNQYLPVTPQEWTGDNAIAATHKDKTISLIRKAPYQDTNTKDDWTVSQILTPGGDNFFAEDDDLDDDGIPDTAEDGVNAAGEVDSCEFINGQLLYRMGARSDVNMSVKTAQYNHQDVRRLYLFHYAVIGHTMKGHIPGSSSYVLGLSPRLGAVMALSVYDFFASGNLDYQNNTMSYTLIHELGHNLKLHHGGFESTNMKPNYVSMMNYLYSNYFPLHNEAEPLAWYKAFGF